MAGSEKIRLFKIASDINIGKEAIIEFLKSKGFESDFKPTALLTDEMVDLVYDKFKKEKKAAEKVREKVEKQKLLRKTSEPKPNIVALEHEHYEETIPLISEAEPIPEIIEIQETPIIIEKVETIVEVEPQASSELKILGKVDLNKDRNKGNKQFHQENSNSSIKKRGDNKPAKMKTKFPDDMMVHIDATIASNLERQKQIQIAAAKQEIADKKAAELAKIEAKRQEKLKPKPPKEEDENVKMLKKALELGEIIADDVPVVDDIRSRFINADGDISIDDLEKDIESANEEETDGEGENSLTHKKKKKRKKIIEIEYETGELPPLKGLTIVGKIDLRGDKGLKLKQPITKAKTQAGEEEEPIKRTLIKAKDKKKGKITKPNTPAVPLVNKEKAVPFDKKNKKKKKSIRESITNEDVERAIKETFAGMGESSVIQTRAKVKMKRRQERTEREQLRQEEEMNAQKVVQLTEFVTTADLASFMGVNASDIILKCMQLGLMVSINQRLDKDTIILIADDYGFEVEFYDERSSIDIEESDDADEDLKPRFPIVTIMGHVDHGKTSLLDKIRDTNVVAGEAGGITQHIGAYRVELSSGKFITFLDTPGHEAFTAMRARGAQVTDIVVLVVSADDSVMPQTIEAISHAQAANVPIVVAINKIDKADANPDRIKQQLADHRILVEEWGGKNQAVEISAKKNINVDKLLEKIVLEAELLDLKANPDREAKATVIEAHMDRGLGAVSTIIVQNGTLKIGDVFVCGSIFGRVRAMFDERDRRLTEALPSTPVKLIGFDGLPEAGDVLHVFQNEHEARAIASARQQRKREQDFRSSGHVTLDDISAQIKQGGMKDLNLVIKADVGGSSEALSDSLLKLSTGEVRVNILHKGVGNINESDIMLAVASKAVVIGFNVTPSGSARKLAEREAVDVRIYNIIYDCINEVRLALEGLLTPDLKEDVIANIEVRKVFKVSKLGNIAGCYILSGKITRNDKIRVLRDGLPIFTGYMNSLKRNKDDVREVDAGYECGIMLNNFNDYEIGDIIEVFKVTEVKRTL
jgi:translation initiation factor IF-2